MPSTREPFGLIEHLLPTQRGSVSIDNLSVLNAILGVAQKTLDQAGMDALFEVPGARANLRHAPLDASSGASKDVDDGIRAVTTSAVAVVVQRLRPKLVLEGA